MSELINQWLPVAAVIIIFGERMREVFAKRETVRGKTKETLTFNLFMLCGVLIVAAGITEHIVCGRRLWWATFVPGAIMSVFSFVLRRAAIRALGKFWSLHVEMREGHQFVTSGPFAYARHPVYFSMILELLGIGLILNAWFALAGVFVVFIPTMIARVRMEERALVETFGDAYREFMQTTPAIFPIRGRTKK